MKLLLRVYGRLQTLRRSQGIFRRAPGGWRLSGCLLAVYVAAAASSGVAATESAAASPRIPWNGSRIMGSPEPPLPYAIERVFAKLSFKEPIDIAFAPGTGRLFVAELAGKLFSFPEQTGIETADVAIDFAQAIPGLTQVYGIAFHPQFARNHYVYVCYILKPELPEGTHVSRFTVEGDNPPRIQPQSERVLITFLSGGHNGGCLKFGNDGYLYISTGDGAGPNPPDPQNTGQDVSDLLSSVLRIDVDRTDPGKEYHVPVDNPFVNLAGARPEIWAYGLRNPWRMSFDERTGDLWVGDVGWELWELVHRVERGGNYGWSIFEGRQPIKPQGKRGPTPIRPPVVDQPHSEAASITGGLVYHGARLKELQGMYIYGDWVTGKIWGLRYNGTNVVSHQLLANTLKQVICFGTDPDREMYILTYDGTIQRLIPNPAFSSTSSFPTKLSETGLFASTARKKLAPGILRYEINVPVWSDFAVAERFVALPELRQIDNRQDKWSFPTNAVLGRTVRIELERGNPKSQRLLETQVLHFDGVAWHGYTYRWNEEQTDGFLVDGPGADTSLEIRGKEMPAGHHQERWHFASRAECMRCHNPWSGPPLAFTAEQLNCEECLNVAGSKQNQIEAMAQGGYLMAPAVSKKMARLASPYDQAADVSSRARAYLQVNCAHCHRENAGGAVNAQMNIELPLEKMKLVGEHPTQGNFGLEQAQLVAPGAPSSSVLFFRISTSGQGRMPYLGSREVDAPAVSLIADWIRSLPRTSTETSARAAAEEKAVAELLRQWQSDRGKSGSESERLTELLLGSASGALALSEQLNRQGLPEGLTQAAARAGAHRPDPLVRDLFDRFLPDDQRTLRLGATVQPAEILSRTGNATHGRLVFQQEGGPQCIRCHRILGEGRMFGPDLSRIALKYDRAQLLDQVLYPSKVIDPAYISYLVETDNDQSYTGILVKRAEDEVVLRQATGEDVHLAAKQIKRFEAQKLSAMPEQLLQGLTAQDAADLLEYLSTLR